MINYENIDQIAKPFDPSDGSLSDKEKLKASNKFSKLVDEIFLARMDEASKVDESTIRSPIIEIFHRSPEGRYISNLEIVAIMSEATKKIQIREYTREFDAPQRTTEYVTYIGGEVRRNDQYNDAQGVRVGGSDAVGAEGLEILSQASENYALEVEMGYNDQPVDVDEIKKLRALIHQEL